MNKKTIIVIALSIIVAIVSTLFIYKNIIINQNLITETINFDDGLQKEELDSLKTEDYNKFSMQDIDDLDLDEVDSYYYFMMWDNGGSIFKENATREEREKIYLYHNNQKEAILEMCKKNGDWSLITYLKEYGEYNQKEGLLKDFDFTEIEATDYVEGDEIDYVDIVAKNEEEERKYRVSFIMMDGVISTIDVKLGEVKSIKANNEIGLNKIVFDKEHTEENFKNLSKYESAYKGGLDWSGEDIGITDNFYTKYSYFLDIFIHYSPLEYNKITLKDLDIENQTAKFEVDSVLECKRRTYEVKYILNDNSYLDDVKVNMQKEQVIDLGKPEKQSAYWIYKNSDWSKLKLTENFINKYYNIYGLFKDLNIIKFNNISIVSNKDYIYRFVLDDNSVEYYFLTKKMTSKNEIDDIVYEKLPYDSSMTLEEVKAAYIRDYVEKK